MRLDEAVKAFLDGKKVEHESDVCLCWTGSTKTSMTYSPGSIQIGMPIDGWRLKRETLNPMQAWERMKAGKVVRSEAGKVYFRIRDDVFQWKDGCGWVDAASMFSPFMDATDLYEVEDE